MPGMFQTGPGNPSKIMYSGPAAYGNEIFRMGQGDSEGVALQRMQQQFAKDTQLPFQAGQAQADRDQQSKMLAAQLGFTGNQNAFDRAFQGQQADAQRAFEGGQAEQQRLFQGTQNAAERANQLSIANLPWQYKQGVFDRTFPLIQGLLNGPNGVGSSTQGLLPPEPPGGAPDSVWTDQQVQQQVNAARASNDQTAATQSRRAANQTAGQGFGSQSPLLAALQGQIQAANLGANADTERNIRLTSAQANAGQATEAAKVRAQNYATQADALARQRQSQYSLTSSLIAALAGLGG